MTVYELMKDSNIEWIGEIPNHWDIKPLKMVITDRTGGAWGEDSKHDDNDRICMRIADFDFDRGVFKDKSIEDLTVRNYPDYQINSLTLKKGDIVVEKSGGGEKTPVGRAVLFDKDYSALYANFTDRIRVDSNVIFPKFMEYWWRTMYFKTTTTKYIKQTTGIQNLDMSALLRIEKICFPLKEEQMRIISYLDSVCSDIDTAITEGKASIEDYKLLKQSIITKAVTKGLNPNAPMIDSGIEWLGEIPKHWIIRPLKAYIDILPGYAFSSNEFNSETGIPLLRGINVTPNALRWNETVFWNHPITEQIKPFELCENDLVIGLDRPWISEGTRVAFVTKEDLPCLLLQRVCRIRSKGNIDIRFVYHTIAGNTFKEALSTDTTGVSVPHISTKQIQNYVLSIPSLDEQTKICDYLDKKCSEIDSLITEKQAMITDLEAYKKSLIFEVVTGKRKVC